MKAFALFLTDFSVARVLYMKVSGGRNLPERICLCITHNNTVHLTEGKMFIDTLCRKKVTYYIKSTACQNKTDHQVNASCTLISAFTHQGSSTNVAGPQDWLARNAFRLWNCPCQPLQELSGTAEPWIASAKYRPPLLQIQHISFSYQLQ